ncbi:MAG: RluA family pseudouridine synthase [Thermodesulfobacteriota bacterium]
MQQSFTLPRENSSKRADIIFSEIFNQHSRSQIRKYIKEGHILIDGNKIKPSKILNGGEFVSVKIPEPEPIEATPENIDLDIVYENSDFVIVNKPAGMVVHAGAGNKKGTLVNALLHHCKDLSGIGGKIRPGIVHRLDKDTSGIIVVAKNDFTHSKLADQFKNKEVSKVYLAIVHGRFKSDVGMYSSKIGRHKKNRKKMSSNTTSGRDSITNWKVLKKFNNSTLVQVMPKTGRTHQIRAHFSDNGHPLLSDILYGNSKKDKELFRNLNAKIDRHALHAYKIGFINPRNNQQVDFSAKLPNDFLNILNILEAIS